MNLFIKLFRSRDKPQNFYHFSGWPFVFGRSASGKKVNEFTAMQTTAVYACVRILAESIASLPLHVYEYKGQGKERVPGHPLYFLLHDSPNPEMTSFIFRETAMIHLLLLGNSFSQIIRDGMRRVVGPPAVTPANTAVTINIRPSLFISFIFVSSIFHLNNFFQTIMPFSQTTFLSILQQAHIMFFLPLLPYRLRWCSSKSEIYRRLIYSHRIQRS